MYKINTQKLVRQITPPHRRTSRRIRIAEMLMNGLTLIWSNAHNRHLEDLLMAKFIPQIDVIQFHLDRVVGRDLIKVEFGVTPGNNRKGHHFYIPQNLDEQKLLAYNKLIETLNITHGYVTRY